MSFRYLDSPSRWLSGVCTKHAFSNEIGCHCCALSVAISVSSAEAKLSSQGEHKQQAYQTVIRGSTSCMYLTDACAKNTCTTHALRRSLSLCLTASQNMSKLAPLAEAELHIILSSYLPGPYTCLRTGISLAQPRLSLGLQASGY